MPATIQPPPVTRITGSSTIATTNAPAVPSPPSTAITGTSTPATRSVPGECHSGSPSVPAGRLASGRSWRRRINEAWATVNDAVAPKA